MSRTAAGVVASALLLGPCRAEAQTGQDTRAGLVAEQQAEKATRLHPYEPARAEAVVTKLEQYFVLGNLRWHPFLESAYAGGGFTAGLGYLRHVSAYNTIDLRGNNSLRGYKRLEVEYRAPRLFDRRGALSVVGGWREATRVGFYGLGTSGTSVDDQTAYGFRQSYLSGRVDVRPTRGIVVLGGGLEYSRWSQRPGKGGVPSVDQAYTPDTLPGLGASPTYLQLHGTVGVDWRPSPGYARSGGYYAVTARSYLDGTGPYSFRQVDYDAVQHVPLFRDAWVLSLRGRVETTYTDSAEMVPFFMLPALGNGSTLRGFQSWRFRDRNSLLLSAEWRVLVNNFVETALFYDAGTVASSRRDLRRQGLRGDYGIGLRLHGPAATPVRVDLARSNEGLLLVLTAGAAF